MTVTRVLFALALLATVAGCAQNQPMPEPMRTVTPIASATTSAPESSPAPEGDAFLAALRSVGIPVSLSGEPERLICKGVGQQLAAGASPDKLATDLTAAGYTKTQASAVVQAAQDHPC